MRRAEVLAEVRESKLGIEIALTKVRALLKTPLQPGAATTGRAVRLGRATTDLESREESRKKLLFEDSPRRHA
jgi:hypothetical protein